MPSASEWKVPASVQPKPEDYAYDLDAALSAVVGIRALIPGDAFTAETLGTERAGNGVLIRADGLVLTIGYLVTEAETIWLTLVDGRAVPGTVLAYDQATGFGLIQALARLDLPALPIGQSSAVSVGERVVVGGAGGRHKSVAARVVAKQEFAGYWEYVVDEAIFTAPSHPNWGGTALIGPRGELIGIGSLQLQEGREQGPPGDINMMVPIDLLGPIFDDLLTLGQPKAHLRTGDVALAVAGSEVHDLAGLYRKVWSLGPAGLEIPMSIYRDGKTIETRVKSGDRARFLKAPKLH